MKNIRRRDFLKLLATVPAGLVLKRLFDLLENSANDTSTPHIIVLVLDALTARNMSLYGYPRKTTPNIERFASRANVYHFHHSAGTYTTPGVASLLTGTYPWTHRATIPRAIVARDIYTRNIFNLLESRYNRIGYTQNFLANYVLSQFGESIEQHLPMKSFSELELYLSDVEQKDHSLRFRAFDDFLFDNSPPSGSLVFGTLYKYKRELNFQSHLSQSLQIVPQALLFDINLVFAKLASQLIDLKLPSFCYVHLLPPHDPYLPKKQFRNLFKDAWEPTAKPVHPLISTSYFTQAVLNEERLTYDQFIATTDAAFGNFIDEIEKAGLLEKSYVILTSDHGESFERGYLAHSGPLAYETSVHIPLIISAPGQTKRRDFYSTTNSVDLLPSLLNLANLEVPNWCEGKILPGLGGALSDNDRSTFSMDAKKASVFGDLSPITIAMYQGDHKIIYYKGYDKKGLPYNRGLFELYNFREDPEELNNLIDIESAIAQKMQERLLEAYNTANHELSH